MALQPISEPTPASPPAITPAYRRYALLILLLVSLINVWAAFHYFMAGRTLRADLARAQAGAAD